MKEKDLGISTVRLIAMLGIVICHTIGYYTFIPQHENLGQLFNSGVGIFLFISGLLYGLKSKQYTISFFVNRYLKIGLPVAIWITFLFVIQGCPSIRGWLVLLFNLEGLSFVFEPLAMRTHLYGVGPLWFITVIFMCYLLLPLLEQIKKHCSRVQIGLITLFSWCVAFAAGLGGVRLGYFSLFLLGFFWPVLFPNTRRQLKRRNIDFFVLIPAMLFGIALRLVFRRYFDGTNFYNIDVTAVSMTIFELGFTGFVLGTCDRHMKRLKAAAATKLYQFLDKNNFFIYIVHAYLITLTFDRIELLPATVVFIYAVGGAAMSLRTVSEYANHKIRILIGWK